MANAAQDGRRVTVGFKRATTWGTHVQAGAGDEVKIRSDSVTRTLEMLDDDSLGNLYMINSDKGKTASGGNLDMYARYESLDVMIALAMGTAGTPSTPSGATLARENDYRMKNTIDGLFGTLAILHMVEKVREYPGVKVRGFNLTGEMNAPLIFTPDFVCDDLALASTANTYTSLASVTMPNDSEANRIIMNSSTSFWINDQASTALDSNDALSPSGFDFSFNRNSEGDNLADGTDTVDEPTALGFPTTTLTLNFPRENPTNQAFFANWDAFTAKKALIKFQGNLIESGQYYEYWMYIPHLKVANPTDNIADPGKIPLALPFNLYGASTAPTGMTSGDIGYDLVEPFGMYIKNKRTTDPLT